MAQSITRILTGTLVLLGLSLPATADVIEQVNAAGTGPGLKLDKATIRSFNNGSFQYLSSSGNPGEVELAKVWRLEIDGQGDFNRAELALAGGDWDNAITNYAKAVRVSEPAWLPKYAAQRLVEAGKQANRLDAAVQGYAALATLDPAAAQSVKPQVQAGDPNLAQAEDALVRATERKLPPAEAAPMLSLLLEIQQVRGNDKGVEQTLAKLTALAGGGKSNDPKLASTMATVRLSQAKVAVEKKNYAEALSAIDQDTSLYTVPSLQADALFLRAQALQGQAGDDHDKLLNAALAYMRVVAHFSSKPDAPHVAQSLLQTGIIHEQLGEPATARTLYRQVQSEYPDAPAAGVAAQRLAKLPE